MASSTSVYFVTQSETGSQIHRWQRALLLFTLTRNDSEYLHFHESGASRGRGMVQETHFESSQ